MAEEMVAVIRAGKTVRIDAVYRGSRKSLLWLKVSKDGSLYTSFAAKPTSGLYTWEPTALPDGTFRFEWDKARPDAEPPRQKISFHASGVINSGSGRNHGVNLRLLSHRTLLASFFPRHPDHWPPAGSHTALVVEKLLQDECPLTVSLYYQPAGELPFISSNLEAGQFALPLGVTGVEGHERVLLHLVFQRERNAADWPPYWVIAHPSVKGRTGPTHREEWIEPAS